MFSLPTNAGNRTRTGQRTLCPLSSVLCPIAIGLILLVAFPAQTVAQLGSSEDKCIQKVNLDLAREQRSFRASLYGKPEAKDAPQFDVRFSMEGHAWIKVSDTEWRSTAKGFENTTWFNTLMDDMDEHSENLPIKGIFSSKQMLTSELIPLTLINMRALQCRTYAICEITRRSTRITPEQEQESIDATGEKELEIDVVRIAGCTDLTDRKTYSECHFGDKSEENAFSRSHVEIYCQDVVRGLMEREAEMLKTTVEYDAAYRSLLQFAGNFDLFLAELRETFTGSIRDAVSLIGKLGTIPCFISSCDETPEQSSSSSAPTGP